MRIKIVGPITPARLADALEASVFEFTKNLGDEFGGIYGANLYLQGFRTSGEMIEHDGPDDRKIITLSLPEGAARRSELDSEQQSKLAEARKAAQAARREQERERDKAERQLRKQLDAKRAALQTKFNALAAQFRAIVAAHGQVFIDECNAEIRAGWEEKSPRWIGGSKKGMQRPAPSLELVEGDLYLRLSPISGRRIDTLILKRPSRRATTPEAHLQHPAWVDGVLPRLRALIERHANVNTTD